MRKFDLSALSATLQDVVRNAWLSIERSMCDAGYEERLRQLPAEFDSQFPFVAIASDYVAEQCVRKPELLLDLWEQGLLQRSLGQGECDRLLQEALRAVEDEASLSVALRRFRHAHMVRIIWRDSCRVADLAEITADLTYLADACVEQAMAHHYRWLQPQLGTPFHPASDIPMKMNVLAMGKMGAYELNLSSDIDLIFTFPGDGETRGGRRSVEHREFFLRLGQKLIKALDETTAEGFVFRVDMRLRPYGNSGALVLSFDAMESYYEQQGREWERYAMIKARPIGVGNEHGESLMARLRPFIYRRYIDFGVIESLREMKGLINREVLRRGVVDNVKTGSGGIREVEFIAQAIQLIRGGQEAQLQQRGLLNVLTLSGEMGLLPDIAVTDLLRAYRFLREVEHRIQALQDRQTQQIPADDLARERIASGMGSNDWSAFTRQLETHRSKVRQHFESMVSTEDREEKDLPCDAVSLWGDDMPVQERVNVLSKLGFEDVEAAWKVLDNLRKSKAVQQLAEVAKLRLDKLMPQVILACSVQEECSVLALARVGVLVEAVLRRSAYIALLVENPEALKHLAKLCGASAWIADVIQRYPILLDELINANTLYAPPSVDELRDDLRQNMLRIPEDDAEREMECLRQFKHAHLLRVAASDITGTLPVMKVSDYLTWLAETLMQEVLSIAWKQMVGKYGTPVRSDGTLCDPDFIIVGYGKVGGLELSYSSDLDLVFIHDAPTNGSTNGERSVDNGMFYARLGQRMIHIISTKTASGWLYETDMRLRPSGNSGLLVASLKSFVQYQIDKAWTWEHQALVRARVVAGCPILAAKFDQARRDVLVEANKNKHLSKDVIDMRTKMRDHLAANRSEAITDSMVQQDQYFDLKQDSGGIVDIEFLVQYCVLRWSGQYPELCHWTDNIRILDALEKHRLLEPGDVYMVKEAYLTYRHHTHRKALQNQKNRVSANQMVTYRMAIRALWGKLMPNPV
ncbi:bifunctional glutamine synthetase adenylyltransferase/deadenyltransferase [Gammaproteobacteria bacterium 45_16_T64]|mgnify:CR=1 FL=1|nr:bifunctional glutamine synthetase adenylyltransferase/deadenyltransferase [Gammaproteobacteria bacterium 45_16_T64]